jgi:hypothetical protein
MGILEDLKAREAVTRTVPIYMDSDAVNEVQALRDEATRVRRSQAPSLRDGDAGHTRRLEEAEARMVASERTFTFKAIPVLDFEELLAEYPDGDGFDVETFPPALIAAAGVDPVLTLAEVHELKRLVTKYEWENLFAAAFKVQTTTPRPFTSPGTAQMVASALNSTTA